MRMKSLVVLLSLLLICLAGLAPLALAKARFADQVGTMKLTEALDARGNLGGMTVDLLGFVYVANFRDKVWRVSPEGDAVLLSSSLYGASGNAIDSQGRLLQSNFMGNSISRIDRNGHVSTFVDEGLNGPVGIATTPGDTAFVCNCAGNSLSRVTPEGKAEPFADGDLFSCPNGIAFDDEGTLYVTNFNNHDILAVTRDGEVSKFATVPGGIGNAHITFVKGFFYTTKIMTGQVMKISRDGEYRVLAGTGQLGHDDGDGLKATFHRPNGITRSLLGDRLYINTMIGEYSAGKPTTITVRTIDLVNLTTLMREALDGGSLDKATALYEDYKADTLRGQENTATEMIVLAYSYLSNRKAAEALHVFDLNAGSYPDNVAVQYHLGEAHRFTGGTELAIAQYRRVLELDPEHQLSLSRLAQLGADASGE